MTIDEYSTRARANENEQAITQTAIYKKYNQCLDMMLSYVKSGDEESGLPAITLLKMMCERADTDTEYWAKLETYLAYKTSPDYNTKQYCTVYLRDELCHPFRDELIAYCNEFIAEATFWARGNLAYDNAWIPLDSAGAKYAYWYMLGNNLREAIARSGSGETLLPSVEALMEKARTDKKSLDLLDDWYDGSRFGDLQAVADSVSSSNDDSGVKMTMTCHHLLVERNKSFLNNFTVLAEHNADAKKSLVAELIQRASKDPVYAVELDSWRRKAAWEHLLTVVAKAGIDTKDKDTYRVCCDMQRVHDYRIEEPGLSSPSM